MTACEGNRRRGICSHQLACQILQQRDDARIAAKVKAADAERRRLITSSPFFADAPVAVKVRPIATYEQLFGDDE